MLKLKSSVIGVVACLPLTVSLSVSRADSLSQDSPYLTTSKASHQVRVLSDGKADLELRLEMIERANESIDVETFELGTDTTGRSLLQAMIKRSDELKKQGKTLQVRLQVDYGPNDGDTQVTRELAQVLRNHGVDVHYYNAAPNTIIQKDYRDHRKVFAIDGKEAIVGGRNLSDAYFGLDKDVNFADRDVWVSGPIAQAVDETFNHFWNSGYSTSPKSPVPAPANTDLPGAVGELTAMSSQKEHDKAERTYERNEKAAQDFVADDPQFDAELAQIRKDGAASLNTIPVLPASDMTLISDRPGRFGNSHMIADYFHQRMSQAQKSVLMENYTYIPTRAQANTTHSLLKRGVHVELISNGVHSVNAWLDAWELSFPRQVKAVNQGLVSYNYDGTRPNYQGAFPNAPGGHDWVIHTKSMVLDNKDTWIGTNNADPRSENINSELALVINDNPPVAKALSESIQQDIARSDRVTPDGKYLENYADGSGCVASRVVSSAPDPDKTPLAALNHDWLRIRNELAVSQY